MPEIVLTALFSSPGVSEGGGGGWEREGGERWPLGIACCKVGFLRREAFLYLCGSPRFLLSVESALWFSIGVLVTHVDDGEGL